MADDAQEPTTPAEDGLAHVDEKGRVATGGRRAWVWVQDDVTGHRYDVRADRLPIKGITPIDGYPLSFKTAGRPAKTRQQWETERAEAEQAPAGGQATSGPVGPVTDKPAPEGEASGDEQHAVKAADKTKGRAAR